MFAHVQNVFVHVTLFTWLMNYIGGNLVFSFQKLFNDTGILSRNCACEYNGKHFVVTNGDLIVHNGVSKQSVASNVVKRTLFADLDGTNYAKHSRISSLS